MSSEPDCTASSGGFVLESSLSSIINSHRKGSSNTINSDKISNNNNEDTDCDLEKSVCASSNNNNFNVNNNNLSKCPDSIRVHFLSNRRDYAGTMRFSLIPIISII